MIGLIWAILGLQGLVTMVAAAGAAEYYVWDLPGTNGLELPIMHAGHIPIHNEAALFFWQVQAQHVSDKRRTIFWLNGGPGCSSLDGALLEVGPFRVKDSETLEANSGSWHQHADLVFVDQPLGVGFSYSDTNEYARGLGEMAEDFVVFLERYFEIFPEALASDIYFAGESFAGQYIPYIAHRILKYNKDESKTHKIPLTGLMIGNGWIDPKSQYLTYLDFAYDNKLLSKSSPLGNKLEMIQNVCANKLDSLGTNVTVHVAECEDISNILLNEYDGQKSCFNIYDIDMKDSFPSCGMNWPPQVPDMAQYLAREDVMQALHIPTEGHAAWQECSSSVQRAFQPSDPPSYSLLPELLDAMPILMFNGERDFICNHLGNERLIKELNWKGSQGFSDAATKAAQEFLVDGEPAGQVISERSLTYVKVYNASHMLPYDKPSVSDFMYRAFVGLDHWNGTHQSDTGITEPERQKIASDATWKAYYKAGTAALVIIIIMAAVLGVIFAKSHHGNIFREVFGGLSRWKVRSRQRQNKGDGSYVNLHQYPRIPEVILEEDEEELEELDSSDRSNRSPV